MLDPNCQIVRQELYTAWGRELPGSSSGLVTDRHSFTQREDDSESGLIHSRARTCDPRIGRFIQKDPVRQLGQVTHYTYADLNPVSNTDPTGTVSASVTVKGDSLDNLMKATKGTGASYISGRPPDDIQSFIDYDKRPPKLSVHVKVNMFVAYDGGRDDEKRNAFVLVAGAWHEYKHVLGLLALLQEALGPIEKGIAKAMGERDGWLAPSAHEPLQAQYVAALKRWKAAYDVLNHKLHEEDRANLVKDVIVPIVNDIDDWRQTVYLHRLQLGGLKEAEARVRIREEADKTLGRSLGEIPLDGGRDERVALLKSIAAQVVRINPKSDFYKFTIPNDNGLKIPPAELGK
jgi:RHS repeat-associated protein